MPLPVNGNMLRQVCKMPPGYFRQFLPHVLVAGLLAAFSPLQAMASENQNRPNFIVILADDMGWGDFSSYGATRFIFGKE